MFRLGHKTCPNIYGCVQQANDPSSPFVNLWGLRVFLFPRLLDRLDRRS